MIIQKFNKTNAFEVENLVRESFWNVYAPGCDEHYLIHKLFGDQAYVPQLNYVAMDGDKIVGAIFYCWGKVVDDNGNPHKILNLGPIAVLPNYQRNGIGSQLIKYTLCEAQKLNYNAVVLCGDVNYYHRFGFDSASKLGIFYDGMDQSDPADFFMVKPLQSDFALRGTYHEADCYVNIDKMAADEFDKQFPPKQKLKLDTQIF